MGAPSLPEMVSVNKTGLLCGDSCRPPPAAPRVRFRVAIPTGGVTSVGRDRELEQQLSNHWHGAKVL